MSRHNAHLLGEASNAKLNECTEMSITVGPQTKEDRWFRSMSCNLRPGFWLWGKVGWGVLHKWFSSRLIYFNCSAKQQGFGLQRQPGWESLIWLLSHMAWECVRLLGCAAPTGISYLNLKALYRGGNFVPILRMEKLRLRAEVSCPRLP